MEDVPLRISSDERDFEMDEREYLLQPSDHDVYVDVGITRNPKRCDGCSNLLLCRYVLDLEVPYYLFNSIMIHGHIRFSHRHLFCLNIS